MIDISGQWTGTYTYGPEYGESLEGRSEMFILTLTELDAGSFEGICHDVGENELAQVQGYVERSFISFTKHYDNPFWIDGAGMTHPLEGTLQWHLHYYGEFDAATGLFSGEWELTDKGDTNGFTGEAEQYTGAWEMRKA